MARGDRKRLRTEASLLFLRVTDQPDDPDLRRERDQWLARGADERAAYAAVAQAWRAADPRLQARSRSRIHRFAGARRRRARAVVGAAAAAALIAVAVLGWLPAPFSDHATGAAGRVVVLATGDQVHLDAHSAFDVALDADQRRLVLRSGAVFVTVAHEDRPLVIAAHGIEAEALGTAFAVEVLPDSVAVSVAEGQVAVRVDGVALRGAPGDRIVAAADGRVERSVIAPDAVAAWRNDTLEAEDVPLAEVAATIDRRIRGPVIVTGAALASRRITGSFDLTRPFWALRTVAATQGARVIAMPPLVTLVVPEG